jgi:hypothetical protein
MGCDDLCIKLSLKPEIKYIRQIYPKLNPDSSELKPKNNNKESTPTII